MSDKEYWGGVQDNVQVLSWRTWLTAQTHSDIGKTGGGASCREMITHSGEEY